MSLNRTGRAADRARRPGAAAASGVGETTSLVASVKARGAGTCPTAGIPPSAAGAARHLEADRAQA